MVQSSRYRDDVKVAKHLLQSTAILTTIVLWVTKGTKQKNE